MSDNLAIIRRVIEEHHTIRGQIKRAGERVSDLEVMSAASVISLGWVVSSAEALAEKQNKIQQAMSYLCGGLNNHFVFEEEVLPPLLGEVLMQALLLEHQQIKKELDQAKSMLADIKLKELSRDELLSQKSRMRQVMDGIYRMIEEHAWKEEIMLRMMQRALEEKGKSQ